MAAIPVLAVIPSFHCLTSETCQGGMDASLSKRVPKDGVYSGASADPAAVAFSLNALTIARRRTDLPVPADPVKKKFSPFKIRSRTRACCAESGGSGSAGTTGGVAVPAMFLSIPFNDVKDSVRWLGLRVDTDTAWDG